MELYQQRRNCKSFLYLFHRTHFSELKSLADEVISDPAQSVRDLVGIHFSPLLGKITTPSLPTSWTSDSPHRAAFEVIFILFYFLISNRHLFVSVLATLGFTPLLFSTKLFFHLFNQNPSLRKDPRKKSLLHMFVFPKYPFKSPFLGRSTW
jgi:hypothetical protein